MTKKELIDAINETIPAEGVSLPTPVRNGRFNSILGRILIPRGTELWVYTDNTRACGWRFPELRKMRKAALEDILRAIKNHKKTS